MEERISQAVASAVASSIPEMLRQIRDESSDKHELQNVQTALTRQIEGLGTKIDGVRTELADGNTRFALLERDVKDHRERLDEHSDRIYARPAGATSALQPTRQREEKKPDAPLIHPKVWNVLILAVVGAIGTGAGALAWERFRGSDPAETKAPVVTGPRTLSAPAPSPVAAPAP